MPKNYLVQRTLCALALSCASAAAAVPVTPAAAPTITRGIDDNQMMMLHNETPVAMHAVRDMGALPSGQVLEHLQLVLKRPAARQAALDKLVADQQNPASPQFHKWVDPAEFGAAFGPSSADVAATARWLASRGFTVNAVAPNLMSIDFSGTAGQVEGAFRTSLHNYVEPAGAAHMGNASAPAIPAALSSVVQGVTLSNFFPRPNMKPVGAVRRSGATGRTTITHPAPGFTFPYQGGNFYAVTPQDLATIYNINPARDGSPLIGFPVAGKGVTLIVAEQTDIQRQDWRTFRTAFGLAPYAGRLSFAHPAGCADPGYTADEGEAALDAEYAGAVAPDAMVIEASCAGTQTTFGVMTTLQGLVNSGPRGSVISISYGGCEQGNGLSFQAMWTGLVEQGAAEGISIFLSSGDGSVAGCDNFNTTNEMTAGLAVSGLASSAYVTAVGGTDFSDTADGTNAKYWTLANGPFESSALSYIPEIPWSDTCSNSVIWKAAGAASALAYCNSPTTPGNLDNIVGGSGGKSLYYAKPDWQSLSVPGVPNDGARDLPDVSMFAANGIWAHFYIFCMSDANEGGVPCSLTNTNDLLGSAAGGTSFAAPVMAGVQALVVQVKGGPVGNMAPRLYQLAALEYGNPHLLATCKSGLGANISAACVFNNITRGDISVPCKIGSPNCYNDANSTLFGVSSTSKSALRLAYPARTGWSFATGLGSVNVTNLLASY